MDTLNCQTGDPLVFESGFLVALTPSPIPPTYSFTTKFVMAFATVEQVKTSADFTVSIK